MAVTVEETKIYSSTMPVTVATAVTGFLSRPPRGFTAVYAVPSNTEKK